MKPEGGRIADAYPEARGNLIRLNHLVQAGERGLPIVESRDTAHSNQVRELILSDSGVMLADPMPQPAKC